MKNLRKALVWVVFVAFVVSFTSCAAFRRGDGCPCKNFNIESSTLD